MDPIVTAACVSNDDSDIVCEVEFHPPALEAIPVNILPEAD